MPRAGFQILERRQILDISEDGTIAGEDIVQALGLELEDWSNRVTITHFQGRCEIECELNRMTWDFEDIEPDRWYIVHGPIDDTKIYASNDAPSLASNVPRHMNVAALYEDIDHVLPNMVR